MSRQFARHHSQRHGVRALSLLAALCAFPLFSNAQNANPKNPAVPSAKTSDGGLPPVEMPPGVISPSEPIPGTRPVAPLPLPPAPTPTPVAKPNQPVPVRPAPAAPPAVFKPVQPPGAIAPAPILQLPPAPLTPPAKAKPVPAQPVVPAPIAPAPAVPFPNPNLPVPNGPQTIAPMAIPTATPDPNAIGIEINGARIVSDPAPLLEAGTVYVPLRGVLESLNAKVNYDAADDRVDIEQNGRKIIVRPQVAGAIVDLQAVNLVPPKRINGRVFVPLRALAELFGYGVNWLGATRTVQITVEKAIPADHRAALDAAGRFGVLIDIHRFGAEKIDELLDNAQLAGVGLVKVKFDWATLEPTKGSAFQWTLYDQFVAAARKRKLVVVGIFGDTAPWAATFSGSDANTVRRSPPRDSELPAWSNYVKRVVGRYGNDVHAWQVWTNPSAANFLTSKPSNYRKLVRAAVEAAKSADPQAIVHIAEIGGADLQNVGDFLANGLTPLSDGIEVYPASSWQQGSVAAPEEIIRPYSTLRQIAMPATPKEDKRRDYWFGGLGFPVATQIDAAKNGDVETRSLRLFTPKAQADYIIKTTALGLALGSEKVFVGNLRDTPDTAVNNGIKLESGLQDSEGVARLSFIALQTFSRVVGNKPFMGALSFNSKAIVLLFDDKKSGVIVAWSPEGDSILNLGTTGVITPVPGVLAADTLPNSQIISSSGEVLAGAILGLRLSASPVFITNSSLATAQAVAARGQLPKTLEDAAVFANAPSVSAELTQNAPQNGLFWRKYKDFPSEAQKIMDAGSNKFGLATEPQRDIYDLRSLKPFIHFDVADDYAFNLPGEQYELVIEVKRPYGGGDSLTTASSGFRVEYDSITGDKNTVYQPVEPGDGFVTYTIPLPNVQFANANGYDFLINAAGSKRNLVFTSVTLRKISAPQ